ncbi:unnamed protein product [Rotaria magnacalcarata]
MPNKSCTATVIIELSPFRLFQNHIVTYLIRFPSVMGGDVQKYEGVINDGFDDNSDAQRIYYDELISFLKNHLGASCVIVFNHLFRSRGPPRTDDQCDVNHKNPVFYPYVDLDPSEAQWKLKQSLGDEEAEKATKNRFQIINIWRPLGSEVIRNKPLTVYGIDPNVTYVPNEPDLLEPLLINPNDNAMLDRLLGCAYGQALGDAYGLSTEFETREKIHRNYPDASVLIPFPNYITTIHSRRWKRGDWTDDTDQWILILDTLTEGKGDEKVFAKKLKRWIENGFREVGDSVGMGLGANVQQVVYSDGYLTDPLKISEMVWERSNRQAAPNGAVMRCSASAFVHYNDREKVKSTTISMCKTTHFDPRCIASCLAVCLTITHLVEKKVNDNEIEPLIKHVQDETIEILGDNLSREHRELFLWHIDPSRTLRDLELDDPKSIGFTYKCLASGFYGLRSKRSFQQTLNDLIRCGGDADTNGAVCGTMYGARYGYKSLPAQWLRAMPFKKWFDQKIISCLTHMNFITAELIDT